MTFYYCGKTSHLVRDYRSRREALVQKLVNRGKVKIVVKEEIIRDFNKVWVNKDDKRKGAKSGEVGSSSVKGEISKVN